jgi:hypothetical protein
MTDFRTLCAELHAAVQLYTGQNPAAADTPPNELVSRLMDAMAATAAALAQPEPQGPSDEDLIRMAENAGFVYENDGDLFNSYIDSFDIKMEVLSFARAVLARWKNR